MSRSVVYGNEQSWRLTRNLEIRIGCGRGGGKRRDGRMRNMVVSRRGTCLQTCSIIECRIFFLPRCPIALPGELRILILAPRVFLVMITMSQLHMYSWRLIITISPAPHVFLAFITMSPATLPVNTQCKYLVMKLSIEQSHDLVNRLVHHSMHQNIIKFILNIINQMKILFSSSLRGFLITDARSRFFHRVLIVFFTVFSKYVWKTLANTLNANFLQSEVRLCVFKMLALMYVCDLFMAFVASGSGIMCSSEREREKECVYVSARSPFHTLYCALSLTSPRKAQEHLLASKKPDRSQTVPAVSVLPPVNGDLLSPTVSAVYVSNDFAAIYLHTPCPVHCPFSRHN